MSGGPKVHTLILCGSVLRSTFYWADLVPGRVGRVVNDCGERDGELIMSQLCVLMTGMAGRTGFVGMEGEGFANRHSDFGHGGYFHDANGRPDDAYMRQNWLPLLTTDPHTRSTHGATQEPSAAPNFGSSTTCSP